MWVLERKGRIENARHHLHTQCRLPLTSRHHTEFWGQEKSRATLAEILRNQFDSAEPSRNAFRV